MSFHGGGCQETPPGWPACTCNGIRRRPPTSSLPGERPRVGLSIPGVRARPRDMRATLSGFGHLLEHDFQRPRRLASLRVLRFGAGTILPSGPLRAIASFGTVEGHGLSVGTPPREGGTRQSMDAHLRDNSSLHGGWILLDSSLMEGEQRGACPPATRHPALRASRHHGPPGLPAAPRWGRRLRSATPRGRPERRAGVYDARRPFSGRDH